ncbi:MAG: hypothetical protein IJK23_11985 [Clostridia bacterium]|nr:hypothetical protein [Clostridia bacterium]
MKKRVVTTAVFLLFSAFFLLSALRSGARAVPVALFAATFAQGVCCLAFRRPVPAVVCAVIGSALLAVLFPFQFFVCAPTLFLSAAHKTAAPEISARDENENSLPGVSGRAVDVLTWGSLLFSALCAIGAFVFGIFSSGRITDGFVVLRKILPAFCVCLIAAILSFVSAKALPAAPKKKTKKTDPADPAARRLMLIYALLIPAILCVVFCLLKNASQNDFAKTSYLYPVFTFYAAVLLPGDAAAENCVRRAAERLADSKSYG